MKSLTHKPTAAEITTEWTDMVRDMIRRDGAKVRVSATQPSIEVFSAATGGWHRLTLLGDATELATRGDADAVLARIVP